MMIANPQLRKNVSLTNFIHMTATEIGVLIATVSTAVQLIINAFFNARSKSRLDIVDSVVKSQETLSDVHTNEIEELKSVVSRYQIQLSEKEAIIVEQDKMIARFKIEMLEYKNEIAAYRLESMATIQSLKEALLLQTNENKALTNKVTELTKRVKFLESDNNNN